MSTLTGIVGQDTVEAVGENGEVAIKCSKMGHLIVQDFFTQMVIEGRGYQVRLGNLTTPLTGDINVTTVAAEASADALLGWTIIPVSFQVNCESHAGGTLPEAWAKSVGAVSTAGAAFVPLPLLTNGSAAATTARVAAAGGVTVTAESTTNTAVHFGNTITTGPTDRLLADHEFLPAPVLVGPSCFYVQIAAVTAGPVYFAHFDYIELPSAGVS